jgi:AmiR/NasT family two-component response regulator
MTHAERPGDVLNGSARNGSDLAALVASLTERNRQLERALESRIVIEQAKGVLAERLALAPDEAFEVIRRAARTHRLRIHAVSADIVGSRETPAAVVAALMALEQTGESAA